MVPFSLAVWVCMTIQLSLLSEIINLMAYVSVLFWITYGVERAVPLKSKCKQKRKGSEQRVANDVCHCFSDGVP